MEIKVRALDDSAEKSSQQLEQELLDKHEEKQKGEEVKKEESPVTEKKETVETTSEESQQPLEKTPEVELTEEDVLSHINKRYNKEISSVDELFAEKEKNEELPEDVAAYLKYKKETGRGFDDYVKLNKDFDKLSSNQLLKEYLTATEDGLDEEDIKDMIDEFKYEEDMDEPSVIKERKREKKKLIARAKKFFNEQKEQYKRPVESKENVLSSNEQEEFKQYRQYVKDAKSIEEENNRKREYFTKKTDEVLHQEFKGFEFTVGDTELVYSPVDRMELKKAHSTPMNFVNRFLDDKGLVKDAPGYHKALAVAMNPDKFARFFYEQGKSHATEDVMRKTKNINMSERKAPEVATKGGLRVKSLSDSSGRGLKIKSIKKS